MCHHCSDPRRPTGLGPGRGEAIDADPAAQLDTLAAEGTRHLDLRGAWDKNVVRLSDDELERLASLLGERGMAVSVVASPIGKIGIGEDFGPHLDDFRRALEVARR